MYQRSPLPIGFEPGYYIIPNQNQGNGGTQLDMIAWTRALQDQKKDLQLLGTPQWTPMPCVEFKGLPCQKELPPFDHFLITSQRSLDYLLHHEALRKEFTQKKSYTFGEQTTRAIHQAGGHPERLEAKTGGGFVKRLPKGPRYLALGPKEPATPYPRLAQEHSLKIDYLALYETIIPLKPKLPVVPDGVRVIACFASPSAVLGFEKLYLPVLTGPVLAVSIGPTTTEALAKIFPKVCEAPRAHLVALFETAVRLSAESR